MDGCIVFGFLLNERATKQEQQKMRHLYLQSQDDYNFHVINNPRMQPDTR